MVPYWPAFQQVRAERSAGLIKNRGFERLNLEGGNVACDRIVEDDIFDGDILNRFTKAEKSAGSI
jgi:hypothetical protein